MPPVVPPTPGGRAPLGAGWLFVAMLLTACAGPRLSSPDDLRLRLAPAALGRELMLTQHMEVRTPAGARAFDVALEVDREAVRMAVMQWGQVMARMNWDGRELTQSTVPGWPRQVSAEGVLSDLQLVWWPVDAIRAALPAGWSLDDSPDARLLKHGLDTVVTVRRLDADQVELTQHRKGYTVLVSSMETSGAEVKR